MINKLKNLGFVYDVCAGFQFDLNSVLKKTFTGLTEGHFCDHNCTTENGGYDCPAAFTRNKDILSSSLMSFDDIAKTLEVTKEGLIKMNGDFLKSEFPKYIMDFNIPRGIADIIKDALGKNKVELNLFGGNPELHPYFLPIIKKAKELGWKVTTTTTGKKFMYDSNFSSGFYQSPPDLLAISADDYESIEELRSLGEMSLENLKKYWLKANPLYGQRKKAYESIYVAKYSQTLENFCPILFNIVVHPGNISRIDDILETLHSLFPNAKLNPYPAQSSFSFGNVGWEDGQLILLEKFIDKVIQKQLAQENDHIKIFTPRLPYFLALKSIFLSSKNKNEILKLIMGYSAWRCYNKHGAGRYLQAASAENTSAEIFKPGGHPGCFWNNNTVTDPKKHIWELNDNDISFHILKNKTELSKNSKKPCPGCLMPRLMFDGISTELGLNSVLLPAYLKLRNQYLGF